MRARPHACTHDHVQVNTHARMHARTHACTKVRPFSSLCRKEIEKQCVYTCHDLQGKALHIASQKGHSQVVDMLIANDVDVNASDASGMKAYDLAAHYPAIQRALLLSGRLDAATKVTVARVSLVLRIRLLGPSTTLQLVRPTFPCTKRPVCRVFVLCTHATTLRSHPGSALAVSVSVYVSVSVSVSVMVFEVCERCLVLSLSSLLT